MASIHPEARSLLKTVELDGAAIVLQKRILWALGWGQDRPGAWRDLLDLWVELGNSRDSLYGVAVEDKLVFIAGKNAHTGLNNVQSDWAKEG